MAAVTWPCISTGDGFSMTITYDDTTFIIASLNVVNNAAHDYTVGFTVGNKSGTRVVTAGTNATVTPPGGHMVSTDAVSIWVF